ncbi:hypothetical protein RESH_02204 [Rhodopirellula europaea SH398]|uniref:Uncharacterized protein n=2 Tax=Rhodopirellula TaxID=265488 RepID=M5SHL8_9BACT|nr:hypothetical protein RESH_02204 [Rhodopirellula europaea SH398]
MSMSIDVSVDNDVLEWRYGYGGDEWRQSIPLHMMLPKPMMSIERGRCWRKLGLTIFVPLAVAAPVQWLEFSSAATIGAGLGALLTLAYHYSPWFLGPVEWATYDTTLNGKTIFLFRGRDAPAFERFIEKLEEAIERARIDKSNVSETSKTPESANWND